MSRPLGCFGLVEKIISKQLQSKEGAFFFKKKTYLSIKKIYTQDEENKKKKAKGKGKERENPVSNKTIVIDKEVLDFLDECESLSGEEEHQKDQEDESEEEGPVLKRRRI